MGTHARRQGLAIHAAARCYVRERRDDDRRRREVVVRPRDQSQGPPSQYLQAVERVEIVDPATIDFILTKPNEPFLPILAAPEFVILERKLVEQNGGVAGANAKEADRATVWLNNNSAGTGPYRLTQWERDTSIQMVANANSWRGPPPFQRVVIRHISDGAAQLLAVRRGNADAAFNLIPEQIAAIKGSPDVRVESAPSLDFVYLGISENPEMNKALAVKDVRRAIGHAIDFDGIKNGLLGGAAMRAAHFLPIGVQGSTEPSPAKSASMKICRWRGNFSPGPDTPMALNFNLPMEHRVCRAPVPGAGAEGAVRPRARRDQGGAAADGSGQLPDHVHRRQSRRGCAGPVDSAGRGEFAVGIGDRRARRQAVCTGRRPTISSSWCAKPRREPIPSNRRNSGSNTRSAWSTRRT
jgi:hypothetical protein